MGVEKLKSGQANRVVFTKAQSICCFRLLAILPNIDTRTKKDFRLLVFTQDIGMLHCIREVDQKKVLKL